MRKCVIFSVDAFCLEDEKAALGSRGNRRTNYFFLQMLQSFSHSIALIFSSSLALKAKWWLPSEVRTPWYHWISQFDNCNRFSRNSARENWRVKSWKRNCLLKQMNPRNGCAVELSEAVKDFPDLDDPLLPSNRRQHPILKAGQAWAYY